MNTQKTLVVGVSCCVSWDSDGVKYRTETNTETKTVKCCKRLQTARCSKFM